MALSFNGGKDCTVLLLLYHQYLLAYCKSKDIDMFKIKTLYVKSSNSFDEIDDFVIECQKYFDLDLYTVPPPMCNALCSFLKENSNIKAIFIGTRLTDPYSGNL